MAKKVYTLNMSITYDKSKPGEFVEKGFQIGFPNVVLFVWTKTGKDGKVSLSPASPPPRSWCYYQ